MHRAVENVARMADKRHMKTRLPIQDALEPLIAALRARVQALREAKGGVDGVAQELAALEKRLAEAEQAAAGESGGEAAAPPAEGAGKEPPQGTGGG